MAVRADQLPRLSGVKKQPQTHALNVYEPTWRPFFFLLSNYYFFFLSYIANEPQGVPRKKWSIFFPTLVYSKNSIINLK